MESIHAQNGNTTTMNITADQATDAREEEFAMKRKVVNGLNRLLSNYQIFGHKLQNFHWNVEGNNFYELHGVFEDMYNMSRLRADELAERVKILGHSPLITVKSYMEVADIRETGSDLNAHEMMLEMLHDLSAICTRIRKVIPKAQEARDYGTEDLLAGLLRDMEKKHWMVKSWLSDKA